MKVAAATVFGEMPTLAGCTAAFFGVGVNAGESTLSDLLELSLFSNVCVGERRLACTDALSPLGAMDVKSWL